MSDNTTRHKRMTPRELIAEFHAVCGVKPGNVTYESGLIVFRYPRTKFPEDRMSMARLVEIIEEERKRQSAWKLCRKD